MALQRLNDREARNKTSLNRKQVFLHTDDNGKPDYIEAVIGDKYRPMFVKNVRAYSLIPNKYIGQLRYTNEERLTLRVDYLGTQAPIAYETLRPLITLLWDIHTANQNLRPFRSLRYLHVASQYFSSESVKLTAQFLQYLDTANFSAVSGYGIEDPVISNFTELGDKYYLIDLDNFQEYISVWQQVGFLIADVDLLLKTELSTSLDIVHKRAEAQTRHQIELLPLVCGYTNRLSIDIINANKGLDSYRPMESEKAIHRLLSEIVNQQN